MWSDEKIEWQQEKDEFGFGFSNRMLGLEESSDYGEEVYDKKDAKSVAYSILLYGICKSNEAIVLYLNIRRWGQELVILPISFFPTNCIIFYPSNVVTLYLILFVEFMRHNIDHAKRGRPFYTAVLTMVYSECKKIRFVA